MSSKFFNVKTPTQIVTIIKDNNSFYELSDGNMIKKDTFMKKYQPVLDDINESTPTTEQPLISDEKLDPNSFFNTSSISNDIVKTIKQTDATKVPDINDAVRSEVNHKNIDQNTINDSLVTPVDDTIIPNNTNTDVSKYKVYDNDDDSYKDFENKNKQHTQPPQEIDIKQKKMEIESLFDDEKLTFGEKEAILRRTKRISKLPTTDIINQPEILNNTTPTPTSTSTSTSTSTPTSLTPIEMMFSTFKRKHDIVINVAFKDKIGEPEFIKMMVENMEGDIVGYYKKKVMDNIMKDLSKIEEAVEREIKLEIYGEEYLDEIPLIKKNDNGLIDEKLILGGKTQSGKQKYKYLDKDNNMKEVLPNTAKSKGYKPLINKT